MYTVLHVIERLTLGGASRALIGLSKYSSRHGGYRHRVVSLLPAQPEAIALAEEDGVEVVPGADPATVKGEVLRADLVQIHWWNAPVLQRLLRSGLPPCRLMVWCHVVGDTLPNLITPALIDHADLIMASNPYTHRDSNVFQSLSAKARRRKTGMIVDPTDFDRVKNVRKMPHEGFNVGYIGTVGYYKMHADFVEMSSSVAIPDVKFLVCGGGIENQLRMEAQRRGTESRFEFLGYQKEIASVIGQMDVYGYPLCHDTYASGELNLQEVMYAGVPPVVFPYGGVKSLVVNQYTGLVVTSKEEYREAIEFLYHRPDERQRMGENAAAYARQMFGAEHAGKRLNEFYERMLESDKWLRPGLFSGESVGGPALISDASGGARLFVDSMGVDDNPFNSVKKVE